MNNTPYFTTRIIFLVFIFFICTVNIFGQTICTANIDTGSLKEAMQVFVPTTKNEMYFSKPNAQIPTIREMLGVNFTVGTMNSISSFSGTTFDNTTKPLSSVFSHVRYYIPSERDIYSTDGSFIRPQANQVPYGNLSRLNLIVGTNGAPTTSSSDPNAIKIYPEIQPDNSIILKQTPAGAYSNPYQNYLNYSYLQIKPGADYFKHGIQATLNVLYGDFPSTVSANYKFPYSWFLPADWGPTDFDIKQSAKAYAMMLARTYAPKGSDCSTCTPVIEVLELGNEPYGYSDPKTYQLIVDGFLDGINTYYGTETANKFKVVNAAFQAFHVENTAIPSFDEASRKDYINVRIRNDQRCALDGYNAHVYSFDRQDPALRPIINPESVANGAARSEFLNIKNSWRWLKDNPAKQQDLYVTEFGFDSDNCTNSLSVGRITQSIYNVRSILMLQRYGVQRAFLYEALDDPAACGYAFQSSGVWKTDRTSKYQFAGLEKLIRIAGDYKFHVSLTEVNNDVFSYILEDVNGAPKYLVAWLAQNINDDSNTKTLANLIAINGQSKRAISLNFDGKTFLPDTKNTTGWFQLDGETNALVPGSYYDGTNFTLSAVPIIVPIIDSNVDPCLTDVTPPVISNCPANISVTSTNSTNAIVTWTQPTATDNCGLASFTSNYSPGATFPIGNTTVTYTAFDIKSNKSICSFIVTVLDPCFQDGTPPVISNCPANISVKSTNGTNAIATWTAPTATDNCAVTSFTSNYSSGATFSIGNTTVTYTAIDKKRNKTTCSFIVTVIDCLNDKTAPVISNCPTNITVISSNGTDAIVTWTTPTATDNCSILSFTSNYSSGATFPVGITAVIYTAIDNKNNKTVCSFNITVNKSAPIAATVTGLQVSNTGKLQSPTSNLENLSLMKLYPNPSIDFIVIELESGSERNITFYIFDAIGRKTKLEEVQLKSGYNYLHFNTNGLTKGLHFICTDMSSENTHNILRFIKL